MKNRCLAALACVFLAGVAVAQENAAPVFPMNKGTTWTYTAHVKTAAAGHKVSEETLRWKLAITDYVESGTASAALLDGAWGDVLDAESRVNRSEQAIVRLGNAYYLVRNDVREILAVIKSGKTERLDDRLADDIWFRLPLKAGDTACSPDQEGTAPMYCWQVEGEAKGSPASFDLAYRTNPDHTLLRLTAGKGVTHWEYAHNGTVSEATLDLAEFHPGGVSARAPASK